MKCKVDSCDRDAMYKAQKVCQMHYFRYMRTGSYEKFDRRKAFIVTPNGYKRITSIGHPLACKGGYVFEHRYVYYTQISDVVSLCAMCEAEISWKTCHIDHIDEDRLNNIKENLRALCRPCNVFRGHDERSMGKHFLTIGGRTLSANAWARADGVEVSLPTILRRKSMGMGDEDAVFSPRRTHQSTKTKKAVCRYDEARGIGA